MKRVCRVMLLLLCSANGFAKAGQVKPERAAREFEQGLMSAEKGFIDAAKKGDVAFFKRTLTDDFSFVAFDGQLYERQDMVDQLGEGGMNLMPYDMKVVAR